MMGEIRSDISEARVDLAEAPDFDLGGLHVSPARRHVRMNGMARELEPKVMQVLVALASERPRVVSRDRLIERCWNGRIVGDDAVNRCIVALRHLAKEVSPEPFAIETVPRVGYWLSERRPDSAASAQETPGPAAHGKRHWPAALAAAALAAALVLALFLWRSDGTGPAGEPPLAIAVLPFRNLAAGDDYFADGLAEEVLAQLSREPQLRVIGRTSSWQFKDRPADIGEIGRRLRASHVLEGAVRSAGDRVRVDVALVRTEDGVRLWSQSFDGRLDDIFAIQNSIAANVAEALERRLVHPRPLTGPTATSGQVYSLYLTARALIRERNPVAMGAARERLRRAIALDPNFAPAWSSLAQATMWEGSGMMSEPHRREVVARAERALALAPDFAEAHGVLGMLLGFDHPLGQRHIKRAAALDPNNAEFQFWLGHVYGFEGDFPAALNAYRRAYAIDPLWNYAQEYVVLRAWEMGYHDEALGYVRRVETDGSRYQAHQIRAVLARAHGDFSEELRRYIMARAATPDVGRKRTASWCAGATLFRLGLFDSARRARLQGNEEDLPAPSADPYVLIRQGQLPSTRELAAHDRNAPYSPDDQAYVGIAVKRLLNAGRAREVVALYDGDEGIMRISHRALPEFPGRVFQDGPLVAAALRAVGRGPEAERILAHLDRLIEATLRRSRGRVPAWFLTEAAQTWALRGKDGAALTALERAAANGWPDAQELDDSSLPDIGDEPAFRSLRGRPRFERIRAQLNAHFERERREAARLRI